MSKKIISTEKLSVSTWINGGTAFVNILLKDGDSIKRQIGIALSRNSKAWAFQKRDNSAGFQWWIGPVYISTDNMS